MNRRGFLGGLSALVGLFVAPKMFDFGKPKGYATYVNGKNSLVASDWPKHWREHDLVYPGRDNLTWDETANPPGWVSYRFHQTVTCPPDGKRIRYIDSSSILD